MQFKNSYYLVLFVLIIIIVLKFNTFKLSYFNTKMPNDSLSVNDILELKTDYVKPLTKHILEAYQSGDNNKGNYLLNCLETKSKLDGNYTGLGKVNAFKCYSALVNNNFDSSIYYGNAALTNYKLSNDTLDNINLHHNIAIAFYSLNKFDSAEHHYVKGLYYAMSKMDSVYIQIFAANLGTMAFKKAYFDLAAQYFEKALHSCSSESRNKTIILINKVSVLMSKGDYKQAQALWNENQERFKNTDDLYIKSLIQVNNISLLQNTNQWGLSRNLIKNLNFDELDNDFQCGCFVTICNQFYHDYGVKSVDTFIVNHKIFYENNFSDLVSSFSSNTVFNLIKAPIFNSIYFKTLYNINSESIDNNAYKKYCYTKLLSLIAQKEKKFELANTLFNNSIGFYEVYKNIDDSLRYIDLNQLLKLEQLKYENELLHNKYNVKVKQQEYSIILYILLFVLGICLFFVFYFKNKKNSIKLAMAKLHIKQKEELDEHIEKEKQLNNRIVELSKSIIIKTNDITEMMKTVQVDNPKEMYNLKRELEKLRQLENMEQPEIAEHIYSNNDVYEKVFPCLKEFNKTERRIFALSVEGYKVKDISSLLGISIQYAHNVRSRLKKKLDLADDIVWVDLKEIILKSTT